jgi:hypothetical protein
MSEELSSSSRLSSVELRSAASSIEHLFEHVVRRTGRVQITRADEQSCVLISKAELDGIEQALEILSASESGVAMRDTVLRAVAAASTPRAMPVAAATTM